VVAEGQVLWAEPQTSLGTEQRPAAIYQGGQARTNALGDEPGPRDDCCKTAEYDCRQHHHPLNSAHSAPAGPCSAPDPGQLLTTATWALVGLEAWAFTRRQLFLLWAGLARATGLAWKRVKPP
jgi:hypothetical protein